MRDLSIAGSAKESPMPSRTSLRRPALTVLSLILLGITLSIALVHPVPAAPMHSQSLTVDPPLIAFGLAQAGSQPRDP